MAIEIKVYDQLENYLKEPLIQDYRSGKYLEVLESMMEEKEVKMFNESIKLHLDLLPQLYHKNLISHTEYARYLMKVMDCQYKMNQDE